MKKAFTITVAGTLFTIEEDAYAKLDAYIASIKRYFGAFPDNKEIVDDIEARIAEQLSSRPNGSAVVTIEDVDKLVATMGRVEDIAGESGEAPKREPAAEEPRARERSAPRKLYRDPDDVVIAGVCSGLAAYFGLDPLLVRIAAILIGVLTGFVPVLVAYLVLAIVVPTAVTPAERIAMRGGPIDLSSFKDTMNEHVKRVREQGSDFLKSESEPRMFLERFVRAIGKIIVVLSRILLGALGTVVVVVLAFLTILLVGILLKIAF